MRPALLLPFLIACGPLPKSEPDAGRQDAGAAVDPRENFEGAWSGSMTLTQTVNGTTTSETINLRVFVVRSAAFPTKLVLSHWCQLMVKVEGSVGTLEPKKCPSEPSGACSGGTYSEEYESGTMTVDADGALRFSTVGKSLHACSTGNYPSTWKEDFKGSRQ